MSGSHIAIDIGGTFTDIVVQKPSDGQIYIRKVPTSPEEIAETIVNAVQDAIGPSMTCTQLMHGTTAGMNALLQRKGAKVALVTTEGFRDIYLMGRGNRPDMYNLFYQKPEPLVRRRDIFEVRERIGPDGKVEVPLEMRDLEAVAERIEEASYEAVAICFLHAYANPTHEVAASDYLRDRLHRVAISRSSSVAPVWREYERTSTTVLDAYIQPELRRYLSDLDVRLLDGDLCDDLFIMQSSGGLMSSDRAKNVAITTVMSGPAGGAVGATALARQLGHGNFLCVDMGGTSFDMSLVVDGKAATVTESSMEELPLLLPMIEIHSIGAGGGSIAWMEAGGLRVGPQSAGAYPGPACYARGGTEPTVTDASVVLGRIDLGSFAGGSVTLHPERAHESMERLGAELELTPTELAEGICEVVNNRMAGAIRAITVGRGVDPRDFWLVAFGGAGPMHAAFIADELDISTVVVPRHPGAFSAWGMLNAELRRDFVRSFQRIVDPSGTQEVSSALSELKEEAADAVSAEYEACNTITFLPFLDMRYVGQEHSLTLQIDGELSSDPDLLRDLFHESHLTRYGHNNRAEVVEVINLRMAVLGQLLKLPEVGKSTGRKDDPTPDRARMIFDRSEADVFVYSRQSLRPTDTVVGPSAVKEPSCTTIIPPGWTAAVDAVGDLVLQRNRKVTVPVHPDADETNEVRQ